MEWSGARGWDTTRVKRRIGLNRLRGLNDMDVGLGTSHLHVRVREGAR